MAFRCFEPRAPLVSTSPLGPWSGGSHLRRRQPRVSCPNESRRLGRVKCIRYGSNSGMRSMNNFTCAKWSRTSCNRLRCPNHQPRYRYACFHTQFGLGDLGLQPRGGEQLFYVDEGVAITAVQTQTIVEIGPASDL